MDRVRVAFLVDVLRENFDGVSNTMHQIISRIPKDRIEAMFITPQLPEGDIGFPVHECPYFEFPFYKDYRLSLPGKMKGLEDLLNDFKPDVIHWSSPTPLGNYAVKYAIKKGLAITSIYHTHFPMYASYYLGFIPGIEKLTQAVAKKVFRIYRYTHRVFAPTIGMRDYLLGMGVEPGRLTVWGRGVNTALFHPRFREQRFLDEGKKKVLFVSRLVREKETDTIIRLYHLLSARRKDIQLVITGDGPDRKRMENKMPEAHFTGKLKNEALSKTYASCDIFLFPSMTETFGNVVLEALASGLPVVAANAGGPKDIVQDGQTGYLIEPKNESAFFDAIVRLADEPDLRARMSTNAVTYATDQNWEHLCEELFTTYESLKKQL